MFVGFITFQKERYFMFLFFFFSFYKLLGPSCPACLLADYFIRDEGLEIYFIKCAVGIDQIICFFFPFFGLKWKLVSEIKDLPSDLVYFKWLKFSMPPSTSLEV